VHLSTVNIYKFWKKEILIQPPGEPREQRLGDVGPKKIELHKFHTRQNEWKGQYTLEWKNVVFGYFI